MILKVSKFQGLINNSNQLFKSSKVIIETENIQDDCKKTNFNTYNFFTQLPIIFNKLSKQYTELKKADKFTKEDLFNVQNEVSGFSIEYNNSINILLFSAKISRSRLYFIIKSDSIFISDDLRELLPYSVRIIDNEIAYGIIKFGETPEYRSIIQDIFTIPAGHYLNLSEDEILKIIHAGKINISAFQPYFQISYPCTGGDYQDTRSKLSSILSYLTIKNPSLLVSGGVDSTLLNYLYNEITDQPYPVLFMDFNEAEGERDFVKSALKNTKAELISYVIKADNLKHKIYNSVKNLIYPSFDNGAAFTGYLFSELLSESDKEGNYIDGTLADSCYGVRDYRYPLREGKYQTEIYSYFKEWVYGKLLLSGIRYSETSPRDSYLHDEFLQDLLLYAGPFANLWFKHARRYTISLKEQYHFYYNLIDHRYRDSYWPKYTVQKMLLYAGKQTTSKVYDMLLPKQIYFPFMFQEILKDQGRYSWEEKTMNGIIKAPLKKILESYIDKSFIYRKKMGLQSQTLNWLNDSSNKSYFSMLLQQKNGIVESMIGKHKKELIKSYKSNKTPRVLLSLVLSLSVIQLWININKVKVELN
jgi:hypothetical protein